MYSLSCKQHIAAENKISTT